MRHPAGRASPQFPAAPKIDEADRVFALVANQQHRAKLRRGLAATIVFLLGFLLLAGMLYSFIRPVVEQASDFVDELPGYVEDAQEGRGTIGELIERYDLQETADDYAAMVRAATEQQAIGVSVWDWPTTPPSTWPALRGYDTAGC